VSTEREQGAKIEQTQQKPFLFIDTAVKMGFEKPIILNHSGI